MGSFLPPDSAGAGEEDAVSQGSHTPTSSSAPTCLQQSHPQIRRGNVIGGRTECGDRYRFTVFTDGLIRYEWAPDGVFEDRPSSFAIQREEASDPSVDFEVSETTDTLEIITARVKVTYLKGQEFAPHSLFALVMHFNDPWRYGEREKPEENLGGTIRTLDGADGQPEDRGMGILSRRNGIANIDDSDSMLFEADSSVSPRRPPTGAGKRVDGYLFAYGHDYGDAIRAFYRISGQPPVLPRWALGNWWSRYYKYTTDSYLELMDKFRAHEVPLSVAVLDMDWHLVHDPKVVEAGLTGWTGYTWNRELFPDPRGFVAALHDRGLRMTLNDHPSQGVHSFEDMYPKVAEAVGIDPATKKPVGFDLTSRAFRDAYFDILLRAREDEGCDFWWVDWQQGPYSRIKGVDPLWLLNHYHFQHIAKSAPKERPLLLSRYAGPGSHRYPVGFSGDTVTSWASLAAQPAFTARAANIGYGWWSHDIGGHMGGGRDDELTVRWVQLGVFSPVLRLHSSDIRWVIKEPWRLRPSAGAAATEFLRLRHRLLPYLYTENVRAGSPGGLPLVQPLYWTYPERDEAYRFEKQYLFGSQMLVLPITDPCDGDTLLAETRGWLPPGRYVDFFTSTVYTGDREVVIVRPLGEYPVFLREGSIVPLDIDVRPANGAAKPRGFQVVVVVGADGSYDIMENPLAQATDNGNSSVKPPHVAAEIRFNQESGTLTCSSRADEAPRQWEVLLVGYFPERKQAPPRSEPVVLVLDAEGRPVEEVKVVEERPRGTRVKIPLRDGDAGRSFSVILRENNPQLTPVDPLPAIERILEAANGVEHDTKDAIWNALQPHRKDLRAEARLCRLQYTGMNFRLRAAITEMLLADDRN